MKDKRELRQQILKQRSQLNEVEVSYKSDLIAKKVINQLEFITASTIYIYIDYRQEVSTQSIIETAWQLNKTVAVPKIIEGEMKFYKIDSFDELVPGTFGILEPTSNKCVIKNEGLMIMPGVAFDSSCHRIGYGKGFYDRYLNMYPQLDTIALAFDLQIIEEIEVEAHDICPQYIITESQSFHQKKE